MFKYLLLFVLISMAIASFEEDCLARTNELRAKHSAEPLTLEDAVQETAQDYADYLASIDTMKHSGTEYGENLYGMGGTADVPGGDPPDAWYSEIKSYNFSNPPQRFQMDTGHFTQLVWKGSKTMGCAFAKSDNNVYVVANFNPSGNVDGGFAENVSQN